MTRQEMKHAIFNRCELSDAQFATEFKMTRPTMEMIYRESFQVPPLTDAYVASLTRSEMLTVLYDHLDSSTGTDDEVDARYVAFDETDRDQVEVEYRKHCLAPMKAEDFTTEEIGEMYERYTQR